MVASDLDKLRICLEKGRAGKAIAVCERLLKSESESSVVAQITKAKAICLIWQGRWAEALEVSRSNELAYEEAYCLYKLKSDEALQVLSGANLGEGELHLKAQLLYRLGSYEQARDVYEELVSKHSAPSAELLANLCAACVMSNSTTRFTNLMEEHKTMLEEGANYELAYNFACALIAENDLDSASTVLEKAQANGAKFLGADDLLSEENVKSELALVHLQQGYVIQQGKPLSEDRAEAARNVYLECLAVKPQDEAVAALAANNLLASRGEHELFDSYKRVKANVTDPALERLPTTHATTMGMNKALLFLKMQKAQECRTLLEKLKQDHPTSALPSLIDVSLLLREKKSQKCTEQLQEQIEAHKDNLEKGTELLLALAEINLSSESSDNKEKSGDAALKTLTQAPGLLSMSPKVVAAAVQIFHAQGSSNKATTYIDQIIEKAKETNQEAKLQTSLAFVRGEYQLKCGLYEQAAAVFEDVMTGKLGPLDATLRMEALASFVVASSHFDLSACETKANALPHPAGVDSVDVAALDQGLALKDSSRVKSSAPTTSVETRKSPADSVDIVAVRQRVQAVRKAKILKRRAKLREAHLAKLVAENGEGYDPAKNLPDRERWVPKNMREKAIRARRKKGAKLTGAQGVGDHVGRDAARLDVHAQDTSTKPATTSSRRKGKKGRR